MSSEDPLATRALKKYWKRLAGGLKRLPAARNAVQDNLYMWSLWAARRMAMGLDSSLEHGRCPST